MDLRIFTKYEILEEYKNNSEYINSGCSWEYNGQLGSFEYVNMPRIASKLYNIWKNQGVRCGNPKYHSYEKYGGAGVRRVYSSRAFINWGINEILKRDKWFEPTVGRVGDKGNYEFGNIKLIEKSENSAEVNITDLKIKTAQRNSRDTRYKIAKGYNKAKLAIDTAMNTINDLNEENFSNHNLKAIKLLYFASKYLEYSKKDREKRGVEGVNKE